MDKPKVAKEIITATLPHVPFDGWSLKSLAQGAEDAGYTRSDMLRVFPAGHMQAVDFFFALSDDAMKEALKRYHLETMKIRERIALAVKLRIEVHEGHKEALKRAVSLYMLPFNLGRAMHSLYRTMDAIWFAIGDKSTDFNFYSKRATLSGVYVATMNYWLADESKNHDATWEYLDRRIETVMKIEKLKARIRDAVS